MKYLLFFLFLCSPLVCSEELVGLQVSGDIVTFSVSEFSEQVPSCTVQSASSDVAFHIKDQNGRAQYTLLLGAMSLGLSISIELDTKCDLVTGVPTAKRIWLETN